MAKKIEVETVLDPKLVEAFGEDGAVMEDIYITSAGRDCISQTLPDGSIGKFAYGYINGTRFEVQCDITTQCPKAIADIVKPQPKAHTDGAVANRY